MKECTWCTKSTPEIQVCYIQVPIVCGNCGTNLGHVNWKELQELINKGAKNETK